MWAIVTDVCLGMGYLKREPFGTLSMESYYWNNKELNKASEIFLQLGAKVE